MPTRTLLSWSSGKDSAWALHLLQQQKEVAVVGLLTTFNEATERVAMHGVRRELVRGQARAAGLPLWEVPLPWPCSNRDYEDRFRQALLEARSRDITAVAFGDLFLEDIRAYRERLLAGTGVVPLFPLWTTSAATPALARTMIDAGLRAKIVCVDPRQLPASFLGLDFDCELLQQLPPSVDRCGERGEFHTFCYDGPMFERPVPVHTGATVSRDGFCFVDLLPDVPI